MKARRVKKLDPEGSFAENASRIVATRLAELRAFAPAALEPRSTGDQHGMRIAAKRLRYVLELAGFCFGEPAEVAQRRARALQDVLGEIHDCDVMLPRVEEHLDRIREEDAAFLRNAAARSGRLEPRAAARLPHRAAYRGLEVLAAYLRARRHLLFEQFADSWRDAETSGIWAQLERATGQGLDDARTRRLAAQPAPRFAAATPVTLAAHRFAARAHASGELAHPVEVAHLVDREGFPEHVVAAALLHDVVEDTEVTAGEIRSRFGDGVADLVDALTEDESVERYEDRKAEHRARVARHGGDVAAVYAADKLAKARELTRSPENAPERKVAHYERTLVELRDLPEDLPFLEELDGELTRLRRRMHAVADR